ncbi:MAG: hypothetical protein SH868_14115 [Bythopirellula sp.]|nr:hypothetical protein [Bythopirellula sp.]
MLVVNRQIVGSGNQPAFHPLGSGGQFTQDSLRGSLVAATGRHFLNNPPAVTIFRGKRRRFRPNP